jgi:hypothetical protein
LSTPQGEPTGEDPYSEERAAYEAELSRITSAEMVIQAAVSLLNLGGRRLGLGPGAEGQDLEQVRDAIDGVRGLMGVLERRMPQELGPLRDALSQLQMAYARESQAAAAGAPGGAPGQDAPAAGGDAGASGPGGGAGRPTGTEPGAGAQKPGESDAPGPAESSGRLWIPGR